MMTNPDLKFAVDFKTTYRLDDNPEFCNGFTLGHTVSTSLIEVARRTDNSLTKNTVLRAGEVANHKRQTRQRKWDVFGTRRELVR